jgi:phosphate starvation-inducible protein PhoH
MHSMAKSKRRSARSSSSKVEYLNTALTNNAIAAREGPKQKRWTKHDLTQITPITPSQELLFEYWDEGFDIVAHGSAGTGKAQPLHSKVLTPIGWQQMGQLSINDQVITPDGGTANIVGLFPQGELDVYQLTMNDGSTTQSCADHLWSVWYDENGTPVNQVIDLSSVKQLVESGTHVYIDTIQPHNTPDQELPIDPYTMGFFVGNGNFSQCVTFSTPDRFVVDQIAKSVPDGYVVSDCTTARCSFRVVSKKEVAHNEYKRILQQLELWRVRANDKFIPEQYKGGSVEQRWQLVQGLMDSDGDVTIDESGNQHITFSTSSGVLALDVQQLLWSLGAVCTVQARTGDKWWYKSVPKQGRTQYDLHIQHSNADQLFRLPRKRDKCSPMDVVQRAISSIVPIGKHDAQCIMLDSDDHLYITDDYVITHNTYLALALALQAVVIAEEQHRIIIIRSAVPTREVGFLPGNIEEKTALYELPYHDIMHDLAGNKSSYADMKAAGMVEFMTTSFVRGLTWDNAVVIVEEGENMTFHEIDSVMTRIGNNSRVIFTGDTKQTDLDGSKRNGTCGMEQFLQVIKNMKQFRDVKFTAYDIVRSDFVKSWILAQGY